jgi:16S rRNA G966 N2-methylase RsmD
VIKSKVILMNQKDDQHYEQTVFNKKPEVRDPETITCLGLSFSNENERKQYFLEKLRNKLKDPDFRLIDGFPVGSDEDILDLSDPPYYTACPNPFIDDFITKYGNLYDPSTVYHREPFAADVSEGKNDPIYNAHAYHTKVSYLAIRRYIAHFTEPGDIVLDFFSGTGMTGVASQKCEGGQRYCILNDISPIATRIAGSFTSPYSLNWIEKEAEQKLTEIQHEYDWMYNTLHCGWPAGERDPKKRENQFHSQQNSKGTINFVVWSNIFICSECGSEINFWKTAVSFQDECVLDDFKCPNCQVSLKKHGLQKAMITVFDSALKKTSSFSKQEPVLINYSFKGKRFEKEPDEMDKEVLKRVEKFQIINWYPTARMPEGDESRRNDPAGLTHVHHFYTKRNLIALSALRKAVDNNPALLFWFTSTLPWCGKENRLHISNYFGKKGGQITSLRGTLYIPSLSVETNVFERFELRLKSALVESGSRSNGCFVSTNSATNLHFIPNNTIDYIFIDPPFGDNLMYSELNFIWEAWLKVSTQTRNEAIINKTQGKDLFAYQDLMAQSFHEGYRVLKPGRWITIEFHNSKNSVWNAIQEALQNAGFVIADVRTLDKGKGSFKQVTSTGAVKQDLIISAYRPNNGLEDHFKTTAGTEEGVWDFIRTHLRQLPIFVSKDDQTEVIAERQNYLLFDRMVAFHVQRGIKVPLSAAEFYAGLHRRYPKRDDMFFLPEQVAEYDRKRMTVKKIEQLSLVVHDENSTVQWLRRELSQRSQTYQELQPKFLRELHRTEYEKLPELQEILEENFLKNDKGEWYVPDPQKLTDLEKIREKTLMREFQTYIESKGKIGIFRSEAVRTGFSHCWTNADYEGIIKVAEKLPQDVLQEDPTLLMYYDNAQTRRPS